MAQEKVLRALVRFGLDDASLNKIKAGTMTVGEALDRIEKTGSAAFDAVGEGAREAGSATERLDKKLAEIEQRLAGIARKREIREALGRVMESGKYSVEELDESVIQLNRDLKLLGKTGQYEINELGSAGSKTAGVFRQMVGYLAAAGLANEAKQFVVNSYNMAASAERLGNAADNLGRRFGVSGEQITRSIQEASGYTISRLEALKAGNDAMVLGVVQSEQQFDELAKIAVTLGRAVGKDAAESIAEFTGGIGRQSSEVLDNLGIVVDTQLAYEQYAASIGKSADELSKQEQKTAFANAAIDQGRKLMAQLGGITDDTAAKSERLAASWTDFQTSFGALLGDAGMLDALNSFARDLTGGAEAWSEVFNQISMLQTAQRKVNQQQGNDNTFARQVAAGSLPFGLGQTEIGKKATDWAFDLGQALANAAMGNEELAQAYQEAASAADEAAQATEAATAATDANTDATDAAKVSLDDYNAAVEKTHEAVADLEKDTLRKRLDAQRDFDRKLMDLAEKGAQDREDAARKNLQKIEDIYTGYAQKVTDQATDLSRDEQKIALDYGRKRADIERKAGQDRLDVETNYRRKLADIRTGFERDSEEALRSQDAIAYLRSQRKRDQDLQAARVERDQKLQDTAKTTDEERAAAAIDYEQKLQDARTANEQKLSDLKLSLERQLQEQQNNYNRELEEQAIAQAREIEQAQNGYARKLEDLQIYYNQRYADTKNALQKEYELINEYEAKKRRAEHTGASKTGGTDYTGYSKAQSEAYTKAFQKRAYGGYAGPGMYQLGELGREFVLNNQTTKAAETVLGNLTQDKLLAALGGLSSNTVNSNVAQTFNFSERDDARALLGQVEQITQAAILRSIRGY